MRLIVGLGNPGSKYEHTKHNVGFDCLDEVAKKMHTSFKVEKKLEGAIAKSGNVILLKPLTYMNLSGNSVSKVMNFYKVEFSDILVIFDDIDLPTGKIRIRPIGGSGGHNGMKSIIQHVGEDFKRIRLGVGRNSDKDVVFDVLGSFSKAEQVIMKDTLSIASDAAVQFAEGASIEMIMNKFN